MFIQSSLKENSDILFIYEYPSVADSKSTIDDSNMKRYVHQACQRLGIKLHNNSHHSMLPYALGRDSIDDFFLTTVKDRNSNCFSVNGNYFANEHKALFDKLVEVIEYTKPRIIVCMSQLALAFLDGGNSIHSFRGSMLYWNKYPVLVTYGPLSLYKKTEWHLAWRRDLLRVRDYLQGNLSWEMPPYNITYNQSYAVVSGMLHDLCRLCDAQEMKFGVDIETRVGTISFLGLAWDTHNALVIPFITWDDKSYWTAEQEFAIVKQLKNLLTHPNVRIAGQNFQYDLQYIVKLWGFKPVIWRDTMVETHVHFTKGQQLTLSFISSIYCRWYYYWKEEGKDYHKSFQTKADHDKYSLYNAYDCINTLECAHALEEVADKQVYQDAIAMQRVMQNIVVKPVLRGVRFDLRKQALWRDEYAKIIKTYEAWFLYIVPNKSVNANGKSDWFNSPTQLATFFYKQLQLDPVLDKKTKRPTTNDAALAAIGKQEPILRPLTDMLQSYRSIRQFYNLYLAARPSPEDGQMRTQYFLAGTDTFRLASKGDAFGFGLNLQNISKG